MIVNELDYRVHKGGFHYADTQNNKYRANNLSDTVVDEKYTYCLADSSLLGCLTYCDAGVEKQEGKKLSDNQEDYKLYNIEDYIDESYSFCSICENIGSSLKDFHKRIA